MVARRAHPEPWLMYPFDDGSPATDHDDRRDGMIGFIYDDGGRADAGFTGDAGDCVVRSIAIATGTPYREVYDALNDRARIDNPRRRSARAKSSARDGTHRRIYEPMLADLGWSWTPTMQIGAGCRVHLRADELPGGALVVAVSRHLTAVVDGIVRDTHDPSREGTRCVYGYYTRPVDTTRGVC